VKWLPTGFEFSELGPIGPLLSSGRGWEIYSVGSSGRALCVSASLHDSWVQDGLISDSTFRKLEFGGHELRFLESTEDHLLCAAQEGLPNCSIGLAESFAVSLRETRRINSNVVLGHAIFVEKLTRLLPTDDPATELPDDVILGQWLSRGLAISVRAGRKFRLVTGWLKDQDLDRVLASSGLNISGSISASRQAAAPQSDALADESTNSVAGEEGPNLSQPDFELPGRDSLSTFFREHVIDIVRNKTQYAAMGIGFPAPIILHGPPGTGKTYAVERLTDYLGWPLFQISASSIASPYIHETSKKISEIFDKAIENAPSVIVIDEMDAYLSERDVGSGRHAVEEISEFLRLIPIARDREVLVIGMTNRLDAIDPAILRRGRFDHLILVDFASEDEIQALLRAQVLKIPIGEDFNFAIVSKALCGRPLSDVSFVMREAGRLAARARSSRVLMEHINSALSATLALSASQQQSRIGFI